MTSIELNGILLGDKNRKFSLSELKGIIRDLSKESAHSALIDFQNYCLTRDKAFFRAFGQSNGEQLAYEIVLCLLERLDVEKTDECEIVITIGKLPRK